ncbi:MAG: ABC transporter permease [Pseudomonadota bacterium]|nr:ABC transporter permease [Pseudomonadota bacterium]
MKKWQSIYSKFVAMEYQDSYPSKWAIGGALVGSVLSLIMYWFTSEAFAPALKDHLTTETVDYFNFVFSGELILTLPLVLIEGTIHVVRQAVASGTLETFMSLPTRTQTPLLFWTLAKLPLDAVRLLILVGLAALFFGFQLSLQKLILLLAFVFCSLPFFLSLGLLSATVLILFGRGERALTFAISFLTLLSGLYFPTSVLPEILQKSVALVSPFYFVLTRARGILYSESPPNFVEWAMLFAFGLVLLAISLKILGSAFKKVRTQGRNFLLRY